MKKVNLVVPIIIVGALVAGAVLLIRNYSTIGWNDYGSYHMGPGMMGSWGMGSWGMGVMMLLVWGLVLVILIQLINRLINPGSNKNSATDGKPDAVELLKQRYAKGELNQGEFKTMIHNLKNTI